MKISKIRNVCIGGGILLLALFTSCKNFLDGSGFLAELEKSMSYANAPYVNVTLTSKGTETATLIPAAGTYSDKYKATDSIQLQFEPQINFYFTKWTAEPEDSVVFEDATKSQTTVTIVSAEAPIVITANTSSRPDVVSAAPVDDISGVYRDRTIVVKFNQEMSEDSIYWTYSDLQKEGVEPKNAFKVDAAKSDKDALYYAYWDGKNTSSIKYKNIEIKKYLDQSVNLLEYYGIPKFDEGNTRVLRIPTKEGENAPPGVIDILVIIKQDFYCRINETKVGLSKNYEWTYFTNGNTDNDPPVFYESTNKFKVLCTGIDGNIQYELSDTNDLLTTTNKTTYQQNFSKNKKLYVKGCFEDYGSGPASLTWEIRKVNSTLYPGGSDAVLKKGMSKFVLNGITADLNGNNNEGTEIDLSSFQGEGLYKIDFIASDKNGKSATKSYYFFHDSVKPKAEKPTFTSFGKDEILVELANPVSEFCNAKILVDDLSEQNPTIQIGTKLYACKCKNIMNNKNVMDHSVSVIYYDFADNVSEQKNYSIKANIEKGMILYESGRWASHYVTKDADNNDIGTPIGIIWKVDDITKCQVWALDETTECCWGSEGEGNIFDGNNSSKYTGYSNYQTVCTNYKDFLTWTHNGYPSMWYYTAQKNSYAKNYYPDLGITWYIPAVGELGDFREVYDVVENAIKKLPDSLPVPELKYGDKSFINTYHPEVSYTPNPLYNNSSTKGILYLTSSTFKNTGGHGIYWPVGYCNNGYPTSFYGDKTNHFDTTNKNSPIKGLIDTHSTFVRSSNYGHIAHTMGQVDLSK